MNKIINILSIFLTLLTSACSSTSENGNDSELPKWARNKPGIQRVVALDGSVFYHKYHSDDISVGGLNYSADVLFDEDGDKLTEPEVDLIPISKKIAIGCTPKENKFNRCRFWDLTSSSPKGTETNIENFRYEMIGSSSPDEVKTITSVRLLEKAGSEDGNIIYNLRLINSDLSNKATIESIVEFKDNEKFIKVKYANGGYENFDYKLNSLTAGATNYEMVNGKAVIALANTDKHYLYYNTKLKKTEPLPENVIGYRPIFNSDKYFSAVIKTANGLRYKADLPTGNGSSQICKDIQLQTHYNVGPKFDAIICLNEMSEWISLEVQDNKTGTISTPVATPNKDYRQLLTALNDSVQADYYNQRAASQEADCMKLTPFYREDCFIKAGSYATIRYLINNPKPETATMIHALSKFYVPPPEKKIIAEKLISTVKTKNDLSSPTIAYVLQNIDLSPSDRKLLGEKWLRTHNDEIEQAKNELRKCIKTANSWAFMKERSCARQLGGEEWYEWLENDFNASSKDFVEAIDEAKKIGRDTTKLQKTYEQVKRSEATTAYYAEKDRREREEKAAFGNIYTVMKNVRENQAAYCLQNPSVCSNNVNKMMESYNLIRWQQSLKSGGPTWEQLNSPGR